MDKERHFVFVAGLLLAVATFIFTFSAHAQGNSIRVSTVKLLAAKCGAENETMAAAGTASVVNSAIGAGVEFLADWFLKLEDKKKGHDVATGHQALFDCIDSNGIAGYIIYARGSVGDRNEQAPKSAVNQNIPASVTETIRSFGFQGDPEMLFVGKIRALTGEFTSGQKVMKVWVEPMRLWFDQSIASRGSSKDISITIALDVITPFKANAAPGDGISWQTFDPLLFRSVAKGTKIDFPEMTMSTGAILIQKTENANLTSVKVTVDEVPEGGGNQLLAMIYQAIGESLKEQKNAISSGITDALLERQVEAASKN